MSKYRIGITEQGDAGLDLRWVDKLNTVDGAILITKRISEPFIDAVLANKDKLIVHATITGHGGTLLEPNVPPLEYSASAVIQLANLGFPKEKIVIRVDPIIPTVDGVYRAFAVMKYFIDFGFSRYRISLIDMYPHVRERFKHAHVECPYGENFEPSDSQVHLVDTKLQELENYWNQVSGNNWFFNKLRIESCAEPRLHRTIKCGCVSAYDLKLLGLKDEKNVDSKGNQRPDCLCYSGKTELLNRSKQCGHRCLYCYWK